MLSINNINDSRAWLNKLDEKVPLDDEKLISEVVKNYERILRLVETYGNLSTLRKNLYSLSKFMKLAGETEKYHEISARYLTLGDLIKDNSLLQEKTPSQEKKEISYDEMVKLRELYHKDRLKSLRDNYAYLIMAISTFEPPKRLDVSNMRKGCQSSDENCIYKDDDDRWVMVINKDKVSKIPFFAKNNQFILGKELSKIIDESFEKFPRNFLFSDSKILKNPMRQANLIYLIKSITPNNSTNNDFRSAFVNHFYKESHNLKERNELARRMRHSSATAELHYRKI